MSGTMCTHGNSVTCTANPLAALVHICVSGIVWMAERAFGSVSLRSSSFSALYVLDKGDGFKVRRVHTGTIPAKVIELKTRRNLFARKPVGSDVCSYGITNHPKSSVTFFVAECCPYPTGSKIRSFRRSWSVLVDFWPKPFFRSSVDALHFSAILYQFCGAT